MDVLQLFFNARENVFFNTRNPESCAPLQKAGDFFLTPSRYLLGGKKVSKLDYNTNECNLRQDYQYDYKVVDWIKTALAVALIAPGVLVGSLLKGLSYLSSNVRKQHRIIRGNFTSQNPIQDNTDYYKKVSIDARCTQQRFNAPIKHPKITLSETNLPKKVRENLIRQQKDTDALKAISEILDKHNILWWLDFGTLLGEYRHEGMIPWDLDADIGILMEDHINVKQVLRALPKSKYVVQDWSSFKRPESFLRVHVKDTGTRIDIYHYEINKDEQQLTYRFSYSDAPLPSSWLRREVKDPHSFDTVFPLQKAQFDGVEVKVPNKVEDYLLQTYSRDATKSREERVNNLSPCQEWNEKKQKFVPIKDHPYNKEG